MQANAMTLKKVVGEITAQAKKEADKIVGEAENEADALTEEAEAEAKKLHEKTNKKTQALLQEFRKKELSSLRIGLKKEVMEAKKQIIDEVVSSTIKKIEAMPEKKRSELMEKLVKQALKELPDAKYFYSNKKDEEIVKRLFPSLGFSGSLDCLGGVALENADKSIRVNCTFEGILERVKGENVHELSKALFE